MTDSLHNWHTDWLDWRHINRLTDHCVISSFAILDTASRQDWLNYLTRQDWTERLNDKTWLKDRTTRLDWKTGRQDLTERPDDKTFMTERPDDKTWLKDWTTRFDWKNGRQDLTERTDDKIWLIRLTKGQRTHWTYWKNRIQDFRKK